LDDRVGQAFKTSGMTQQGDPLDVLVVGAGLAGLTAAELLVQENLRVRVLEARKRVGGRTWSGVLAGQAVDFGAEHVGPRHHRVRALARRLGLKTTPSGELSGRSRWRLGEKQKVGHLPPLGASEMLKVTRAFIEMARLARRLPVEQPWAAPSAQALDAISLADWLDRRKVSGPARELLEVIFSSSMTKPAKQISMLHLLWLARRSGGVIPGFRDALGPRVEGGTQQLALGLAALLGSRVDLGKPVKQINQDPDEVEVVTGEERLRARRVIVCLPIPALARLDFAPELPDELEESRRSLSLGRATTLIVGSDAAEAGGVTQSLGGTPPSYGWRRGNTAKSIVVDPPAEGAERLAPLLAERTDLPIESLQTRTVAWTEEEFTGGTYVCFEPGQLTRFGPHLTRPHGRAHFAAAERSTSSVFMEGAIESGQRAAAEVLAAE
jgi:monoamine oxidase